MEPTIAYNPAPPVNPLEQQARILGIKNLMGQGQMQQQQIQAGALQNQETQMDVDSQRAFQRAYTEANGDPDKTTQLAAKYGAKPKDLLLWQGSVIDQKMKTLDLVSKQGEQAKIQADLMQGAHDAVSQADPASKPIVYQQQLMGLKQRGIDVSQLPPQYPGDQQFALMGATVKTHSQMVDEAFKASETAKNTAQAGASTAEQAKTNAEMDYYKQNGGAPGVPTEQVQMSDWMKKNPGKGPADFLKYKATLVPQFNFNMQGGNTKYDANDPTVQAVAAGRMKIGDVMTPRTPLMVRKQFLDAVQSVKPDFDSRNYDVEKGVMKEFTSGDGAKNLTAFNTAIEHATQLSKAADELDNTDTRALNKIGNSLGYQFGSDKTTNFNVIKNALSGEISKVFKGGQATDAEIREVQGPFDSANSPEQLKGAIKNAIALMNSKRDALKQQYQSGIQAKPNFGGGTDTSKPDPFASFGGKTR